MKVTRSWEEWVFTAEWIQCHQWGSGLSLLDGYSVTIGIVGGHCWMDTVLPRDQEKGTVLERDSSEGCTEW